MLKKKTAPPVVAAAKLPPSDLLDKIKPPRGQMNGTGKYSPNLYDWMVKRWASRFGGRGMEQPPMVYRGGSDLFPSANDTLYIGHIEDDGTFIGARLMGVLCNGTQQKTWAYMSGHAQRLGITKPLSNFWGAYIRIGRCAIDTTHNIYHDDARWTIKGKTRTCNWCGRHKERLRTKTVTKRVTTKKWVTV